MSSAFKCDTENDNSLQNYIQASLKFSKNAHYSIIYSGEQVHISRYTLHVST